MVRAMEKRLSDKFAWQPGEFVIDEMPPGVTEADLWQPKPAHVQEAEGEGV